MATQSLRGRGKRRPACLSLGKSGSTIVPALHPVHRPVVGARGRCLRPSVLIAAAGLEAAGAFFGGVPRYRVNDNLAADVVGPHPLHIGRPGGGALPRYGRSRAPVLLAAGADRPVRVAHSAAGICHQRGRAWSMLAAGTIAGKGVLASPRGRHTGNSSKNQRGVPQSSGCANATGGGPHRERIWIGPNCDFACHLPILARHERGHPKVSGAEASGVLECPGRPQTVKHPRGSRNRLRIGPRGSMALPQLCAGSG